MSFISVFATEDFITIMSDGLVSNEKTGEVLQKDFQKFHKISGNQFMAYTGPKDMANKLQDIVLFKKEGYNLLELINELYRVIMKAIPSGTYKASIVVGGIDTNGDVKFYCFINDVGRGVEEYYPAKTNKPECVFLASPNINQEQFQMLGVEFNKYLSATGMNTPNKVLKAQKMLNEKVDEIDTSVNKFTFGLPIKK